MPSLDVVSKVDMQVLDNAVNNTKRVIASRYDFKNVASEIIFDRRKKSVSIVTADDWKLKEIVNILKGQCARLKFDTKALEAKDIVPASHNTVKIEVLVKEGIPKETCQKIVKFIKGLDIKVQPAIQDEQVRISGKQIDDLREVMRLLTEQDYGIPLQFVNMKS